ncbi:Homoserine kinase [Tepidanaerobacter acetatoxydans Re1]|uniref:Homoserine kinase n=2 Tax=Tepidanaerobacter acetatoxydans TaxID=499229 RepID=U5HK54_TEPAE|nr:Homoserine kinase [Tepidanaerobacter acetatoxydans Re1]
MGSESMVRVKIPATTANFGPGFDCLGASLGLYNYIDMEFSDAPKVYVKGEGVEEIPLDKTNLVYQAAAKVLKRANVNKDLKIVLENHIPLARGLGSSAACIVGGLMAANHLIGDIFENSELLKIATEMEGHPDNVVPAAFGGFCLSMIYENKIIYKTFPMPFWLKFVVCIPDFELKTEDARKILPEEINFKDAVFNISRTAMLVAAMAQGDLSNMDIFCQDRLHQPFRSQLIPGMEKILATVREKGAFAGFLSGSGPTVVCLTLRERADALGEHMVDIFSRAGIKSCYKVLSSDSEGVKFL